MSETLYLIDGSGFIFRAYHALPPLTRPDGTPVNAVLGFTNMLLRLLKDKQAHHVAVIFDAARRNFRNDIYPDYKAHRPPAPEDLVPQFPIIREATLAFALPAIEKDGYEADDLIATYTKLARAQGIEVVIVSSDKDLMQLIGPGVQMMDPIKQTLLGADAVMEKFGVAPEKVIEVQALCGDAVDNVPGVPGIGIKTAAQLINEYGDVETLLARAGEIKQQKRRESLIEHAAAARMSWALVRLDTDVPVDVPLNDLKVRNPDFPDLPAFLQAQGFKSALARLGKASDIPANDAGKQQTSLSPPKQAVPPPPSVPVDRSYVIVNTPELLAQWVDQIKAEARVAIDTETTGLTPSRVKLVGISLCAQAGHAAYIPLGHHGMQDLLGDNNNGPTIVQLPVDHVMAALKEVLEDKSIIKIGHNIKYDLQMFFPHGIEITPVHDTMLMSYVLDGTKHGHGLEELGKTMLGLETISYDAVTGTGKNRITFDQVPIDRARDYAAEDADLTLRLYDLLKARLVPEKMTSIYEDIERPVAPVIAHMEYTGVKIDVDLLRSLSNDFGNQLQILEQEIHKLAGHPFNVASPKQLGVVLFDEMGLTGSSRTKTGDWSTSVDILDDLATQGHVIVEKVLEYRGLAKLKSTYTDTLASDLDANARVHTSYGMTLTSTGRLSSSDPNLQNIPIRTENGRKIRKAFIAEPGSTLISVDYSQIELRLVAEIAAIPALKQAFIDDQDIHAMTASQVFGVPIEGMDPMVRRQAKAINFGIIYGISGFGLARQLGVDTSTANGFIKAYFARFPELAHYFETTKMQARTQGFVTTAFGRKIYIDGIVDKNGARRSFAERQAINAPIQGTAADLMKRAMARVPGALVAANLDAKLMLQVHDELVLEAPLDQADAAAKIVKQVMEEASPFDIPIIADYGMGQTWGDAH